MHCARDCSETVRKLFGRRKPNGKPSQACSASRDSKWWGISVTRHISRTQFETAKSIIRIKLEGNGTAMGHLHNDVIWLQVPECFEASYCIQYFFFCEESLVRDTNLHYKHCSEMHSGSSSQMTSSCKCSMFYCMFLTYVASPFHLRARLSQNTLETPTEILKGSRQLVKNLHG